MKSLFMTSGLTVKDLAEVCVKRKYRYGTFQLKIRRK